MLDGIIAVANSKLTTQDLEREISKGLGEESFYLEKNRVYRDENDVFENYNEEERRVRFGEPPATVYENMQNFTKYEEKLKSLIPLFAEIYGEDGNDYDVESIIEWIKKKKQTCIDDVDSRIRWIIRRYPNPEYFYFNDIEDLFVWNNLVHLFDLEHHHKSVLTNGEEVEWYWTYTNDSEQREDGFWYRKEVGYKKIRVPVDAKIGSVTRWIPDEAIIKDLY